MQDKEKDTLKKKLFDMLDCCNEQLSKYKDLRSNGLNQDEKFEAVLNSRKQTITEILDLITK